VCLLPRDFGNLLLTLLLADTTSLCLFAESNPAHLGWLALVLMPALSCAVRAGDWAALGRPVQVLCLQRGVLGGCRNMGRFRRSTSWLLFDLTRWSLRTKINSILGTPLAFAAYQCARLGRICRLGLWRWSDPSCVEASEPLRRPPLTKKPVLLISLLSLLSLDSSVDLFPHFNSPSLLLESQPILWATGAPTLLDVLKCWIIFLFNRFLGFYRR
jgi:hypothetical protein